MPGEMVQASTTDLAPSWSATTDVSPTEQDLKDAIQLRPELVYSIVSEQHLTEMENRLSTRAEEISAKESDWDSVRLTREAQLQDQQKAYAIKEKELKDRVWIKDKLRTEIRESMALEAAAAEEESRELARANAAKMEFQKLTNEKKGLDAEFVRLQAAEAAEYQQYLDQMRELKMEFQQQVTNVENQALELRDRTKELNKESQKAEFHIDLHRQETEQDELWYKKHRHSTFTEREGVQSHTDGIKEETRNQAKAHQAEYYAKQQRHGDATYALSSQPRYDY